MEMTPLEKKIVDGPHAGDSEFEHPAFGIVSVTRWTSSHGTRLFGSDLGHRDGLTIRVNHAKLQRTHSSDWTHEDGSIVEFSMSESQWARFVSSVGLARGVPVTLNLYKRGSEYVQAPAIGAPELSRKEKHGGEIKATAQQAVAKLQGSVKDLGELIASGKMGKEALRSIQRDMSIAVSNLPADLGFAVDQFAKMAERICDDLKTEVDNHVAGVAMRVGMDSIRQSAPTLAWAGIKPDTVENNEGKGADERGAWLGGQ